MADDIALIGEEIHKPARRNFPRRKVIVNNVNDIWSADLVDMGAWKDKNDGNPMMITVIDCYSRYAWALPIADKKGKTILDAFQKIEKDAGEAPKKLWTDKGSEFYNKDVKTWLTKHKIELYSTYSESKAVVVERFNRTLKERMYKFFDKNNTRRWIDELPKLIVEYNDSKHKGLGGNKPIDVYNDDVKKNEQQVSETNKKKPKFSINDHVRISRVKKTFEKGFDANWSREIFKIVKVKETLPYTYALEDMLGEKIEGTFYEQELQKTKQKDVHLVEKVIRTKGKARDKQVLVKWLGLPEKFNSWISEADVVKYLPQD
jgi:hypothetical protein